MVAVTSPRQRKAEETARLTVQIATVLVVGLLGVGILVYFTQSTEDRPQSLRLSLPSRPKKAFPAHKKWPDLAEVYNGREVIANPQYLLDFAIIGFEKSGSSSFMKWLGAHPQVQCFQEEIYDLYRNRTGSMVWRLHTELEHGFEYKRGYKSPIDIFSAETIHLLDEWFPKTRLILSLRHPVLYYESLYNFRIQNLPGANDEFPLPLDTFGECAEKSQGVCTDHANFAQYMYRLGKTLSKWPTDTEKAIINAKVKAAAKAKVTRNRIFVVELTQLHDNDPQRKAQLKDDLKEFLGLDSDLTDNPVAVPGKKWPEEVQAIKNSRKMNICDEQYTALREELMRLSRQSATWILESFIQSDDVYVSSPEFFEHAINRWMHDPCEERNIWSISQK